MFHSMKQNKNKWVNKYSESEQFVIFTFVFAVAVFVLIAVGAIIFCK
jgi:hypothetical protein